jgi:hypothetical protein
MASDLPSRDLDCCLDHAALLKEGRNPPYPSLHVQSLAGLQGLSRQSVPHLGADFFEFGLRAASTFRDDRVGVR